MSSRSWLLAGLVGAFSLVVASVAAHEREARIEDACDLAAFNAAVGEGTCVGDGNVTFDEFLEALEEGGHDAWRFHFGRGRIDAGETLEVTNEGGETHTFTKVQVFGGGFVAALNEPLGLHPVEEVSTSQGVSATVLPAGGSKNVEELSGPLAVGTHRFQCCIHPWMRLTLKVRGQ